jgi:DNA-binding NtrC family response regulator
MDRTCVLVVEDEALILLDIVDQLEDAGFRVLGATNAETAICMMKMHVGIHAIFTDVNMPGIMDGLLLASLVRDLWPRVKIIVTSGGRTIRLEQIPIGSRFFGKPYDSSAVILAIRDMVSH